ncbi:MAG: hypothetical protein Q4B67_03030 [Eubacteriales bacterium]|nr:hypothetical protein [Eubacteriales bacterium]
MDKYEFNLKMEQLKKRVDEGDFATAQKIVDSIDWNRVRNKNLLTLAATVYEENDRLEDAKDKLVLALERDPVGKRILYKLTELAVRSGNVDEAMDYYNEYSSLAPNDPGCLLLQYMIMKVKHVPYDRLIECLECYISYDNDEKWMYELATTYETAGRVQDMLSLCDRISVMFGNSTYGIKALKLKQKYGKLTEEQRAVLYPNSLANSGVRYVKDDPELMERFEKERESEFSQGSKGDILSLQRIENEDELFRAYAASHDPNGVPAEREAKPIPQPVVPKVVMPAQEIELPEEPSGPINEGFIDDSYEENEPVAEETEAPIAEEVTPVVVPAPAVIPTPVVVPAPAVIPEPVETTAPEVPEEPVIPSFIGKTYENMKPEVPVQPVTEEKEPEVKAPVVETEHYLDEDIADKEPESVDDPDADKLLADAQAAKAQFEVTEAEKPVAVPTVEEPEDDDVKVAPAPVKAEPAPAAAPVPSFMDEEPKKPVERPKSLIIEAVDDQDGLDIAVDELRSLHERYGASKGAVKTTAEKLSETGLSAAAREKIKGKDFVIEHAGELDGRTADQIYDIIAGNQDGTIVVLIDNPEGLDKLEDLRPELFDICEYISDEDFDDEPEEPVKPQKKAAAKAEPAPVKHEEPREEVRSNPVENRAPMVEPEDDEEMTSEEFAQYCSKYATDIDCVISGKSMLALYERIELMEEDGIPLTKQNAIDLIEEAADRADRPPIGKRISGMFRSKYDKDGCLILKEEDFLG